MFHCCCSEEGHRATKLAEGEVGSTDIVEVLSASRARPNDSSQEERALENHLLNIMARERGAPEEENVFYVVLKRKPGEAWGLKVDLSDNKTAHITHVSLDSSTLVGAYNDSVPQARRICAGDYLVSVTVLHTSSVRQAQPVASMFKEGVHAREAAHEVGVTVSRPQTFEVSVSKDGRFLGLDLTFYHAGESLIVRKILEYGAVAADAPEVQPLDRIVAVDGISGAHQLLTQALHIRGENITLTFSRPYPGILIEG